MPSMNPELLASWSYSQNQAPEDETILRARQRAQDLGVSCIDPGGRAMLELLCALREPQNVVDIGAGVGVAAISILRSLGELGTLTAIEPDRERATALREGLRDAGLLAARARVITERAENVLGRLADHAYDLVLLDTGSAELLDLVVEAKRLIGPRGVIVINNAYDEHRVAKPAVRRESTVAMRDAMRLLREDPKLRAHLFPSEQGLFVASAFAR
ncbi:O-methyltransferase [Glutamicibacter sp. PS]|uniref:O-methyltransferase n=1 Tax=Glutamicibacter TaxID=1742989 RepID=UPI002848C7EE|nr:class I SAM-dependent methyltransferase [Glutamicibacter sp. PS]MDR4532325.1 class I SAM-dependent methyltransferase [Glutamicibacter sp. PS]